MKHAVILGMAIAVTPMLSVPALSSTLLIVNKYAPAMVTRNSQGYLGVGLREVTEDQMNSFHIPASRGLEIVVIDHDAPAAKAGLKEHDVILRANGETVESVEKFRRMVRETPPGHLLALIISRDGTQMTIPVKVADRGEVEKKAWTEHMAIIPESDMDMSWVGPPKVGPPVPGSGFFATMTASSYYTGVIVDALGPQLASFFGAQTGIGLLVKSVDANSPAANAGIKAGDVIVKVGGTQMATRNDFYRAVRENKSKQVPVTLLRDKKEQTVTLTVGEGKNTKSLVDPASLPEMVEVEQLNGNLDEVQLAELSPEIEEAIEIARTSVAPQMDKFSDQIKVLEPQLQQEMQRIQEEVKKMEPQLHQQMQQLEPQIREQMKQLQSIEPMMREQMKQLDNMRPQLQEQVKQLQNIEPQLREQMKKFQEMEPKLREQINEQLKVQCSPLI